MSIAGDHAAAFAHRHRPDLDGIRGILAVCVVLLHFGLNAVVLRASHGAIHGFAFPLCVDVFFLLSGFVLTAAAQGARRDFAGFAIKRGLRLAPVFYVTTALVVWDPAPGYDRGAMVLEPLLAVPFTGGDPANFPAWSICWELYLPIVAVGLAPWLPRIDRRAALIALTVVLAGLALADIAVAGGGHWYFSRALLGLAGGHLLHRAGGGGLPGAAPVRQRGWRTPALLGLLLLAMLAAGEVPVAAAAVPFIACALVASGAAGDSALLATRPAQWLGAISYPLYLAHIPVLRLGQAWFGAAIDHNPPAKLAALLVTFALAAALTRFVEVPALALSRRIAARRARVASLAPRPPLG